MPHANAPDYRRALLIGLGALLLYRVLLVAVLAAQGVGLHVDEAQYWWWSRELHWGYFSKPPGIAALIHGSTLLFGDSVTGVRTLAVACWVVAAGMLWLLGRAMHREAAGLWAALLLCASTASNWLGLVATTDALLMMGWAAVMLVTWHAQTRQSHALWALAGALLGLTTLGKYTAAALAASWVWLAWRSARAGTDVDAVPSGIGWKALCVSALAGMATLAPHVAWNALNDWPTLRHTAEITLQGGAAAPVEGARTLAARALSLAEFSAGQLLLAGPALCLAWALAILKRPATGLLADPRVRWSLSYSLPLLAIGALQAVHSKAQINWALPMLLGLCMAAGLWLEQLRVRFVFLGVISVLTVVITTAISLHGDARLWREPQWQPGAPDIWGRMRGWGPALEQLKPALRAQPGLPVVASDRSVLSQAMYAWRDEAREFRSWSATGAVRHHYDWKLPFSPGAGDKPPCTVLFIDAEVPDAFSQGAQVQRLAQSQSGRVELSLWRVEWPTSEGTCAPRRGSAS